ncbi:MAG: FHA domain-containing protein [Proteobacteria bacterium]|nr:FHA domain-containing protein [Pseudomonadota bacterium]
MLATCPRCGSEIRAGLGYCRECGIPLLQAQAPPASPAAESPPSLQPAAFGPSAPAAAGPAPEDAGLALVNEAGEVVATYALAAEQMDLGKDRGAIRFPGDPYLSSRHARIERAEQAYHLRDLGSTNGVYVRIRHSVAMKTGDMILIGQQVLRFGIIPEDDRHLGPAMEHGVMVFGTPSAPRLGRLEQCSADGAARDVYYLHRDETVLGRERADFVFADDPYMSRQHATLCRDVGTGSFMLRDLDSANGTWVRLTQPHRLCVGDQLRVGQQVLCFGAASELAGTDKGR